jgi:pimeloyl-ACP methyl ester carboxylesterase
MASRPKPLIILVHGSWHQPSCFAKLQTILEKQGYEVFCPSLPTNSKDQSNPSATHLTDVAALHEQILPFFEAGKEAVIVGHSYGAVPAMVCVDGNSVEERAKEGAKGGFRAIVFLSGFAFPVRGMKLAEAMDVNWIDIQVYPPSPGEEERADRPSHPGLWSTTTLARRCTMVSRRQISMS